MGPGRGLVSPVPRTCRGGRGDRPRASLVKRVLALFACCPRKAKRQQDDYGSAVVYGPLTLREYIATLEPYDPAIHGWRGDEPLPRHNKTLWATCSPLVGNGLNRAAVPSASPHVNGLDMVAKANCHSAYQNNKEAVMLCNGRTFTPDANKSHIRRVELLV